ncbi:MAG: hypothetical protein AAFU74_15415 [Bacteroidota bacterium]
MFTAVLILQLYEESKLDLQDPISQTKCSFVNYLISFRD